MPSFRTTSRALCFVAAIVACAAAAGCDQRPPVNRVQPNVVEKGVFAGEWYFQQTVVDSPFSAGFTFVGEQGSLERIRWEIQEEFLIARRTYDWVAGSEPEGIGGSTSQFGAAIAAYRITSHFDIRREYNPVTGEEQNVIVENSTDRPWYDRQYMRVDWSQNLIPSTDMFAISRILDGLVAEPVAYYVQDENDEDFRPRFERGEDGTVQYMDIVNRMFVEPQSVHIEGFGSIPSCYLYYQDHFDCASAEVAVRNSFLRVDEAARDYQPMRYTGDRMERFGYFVTVRAGYDDAYGVVEPVRYRFANRHNLWMQSHRRDANGALVPCTTDAQCDDGRGSVCDIDLARARRSTVDVGGQETLEGACTIPYRDRTTRPIAYYLTSNFPADLIPDAQDFGREWSSAFVETVASLRENECLAHGGDAASCASERTRPDAAEMFAICHSPVLEEDSDACGAVGTIARPGDLRYSIIGWVNEPHRSSPLGYGPSSADPTTGEIIMGNAFVYGAAMVTLQSQARDILALLNGEITNEDITTGGTVEAWVDRMTAERSLETGRPAHDHVVEYDGYNIDEIASAMDFSYAHLDHPEGWAPPANPAELVARMDSARERLFTAGMWGNGTAAGDARLGRLEGTDLEAMMVTPEMIAWAGLDPHTTALTDEVVEAASPLRGLSLRGRSAIQRYRDMMNAESCVLDGSFADEGLIGLARAIERAADEGGETMEWYGQSYPVRRTADGRLDPDLVANLIRHPIFHAVTAHEVGHTLGLRHNFSGSYDALNYLPEYWNLRDDGNMAPRAWDPMSEQERNGRILENQYSTVMDYGVNFVVTDSNGIGHYDRAAIKMGYGDMVEVFTNAASPDDAAWWHFIQQAGWPVPLALESFTGGEPSAYNYTMWPEVLGGIEAIQQRADVTYTSLVAHPSLQAVGITDPFADPTGRVAVPYMFCSDEQADLNPDCLRYDQGADAYETVQTVADSYWNYYLFQSFRRGRIGFNTDSLASRVHDRFFEKLQRANQIYALYRPIFTDIFGIDDSHPFWTSQEGMGAWTLAAGVAYGMLTRVVTAPEPSAYARGVRADGSEGFLRSDGGALAPNRVNAFDGRFMETVWDFDAGYFWFDQLDRVGYFYDKVIAIQVLTDPTTYFLGRDTDADIRRYQINFGNTFGGSLTSFFRGVVSQDWSAIAPRFGTDGTPIYPTPAQMQTGGMTGTPIDPNGGFSIELYASILGVAYMPQVYNQDYLNRSRIWVVGGAEEVEIEPGRATVEFTDPVSGLTYVAVSYPEGGRETGVGAQMLLHAQAMAARPGSALTLRQYVDNIDIMRRLTAMFGSGAQPF